MLCCAVLCCDVLHNSSAQCRCTHQGACHGLARGCRLGAAALPQLRCCCCCFYCCCCFLCSCCCCCCGTPNPRLRERSACSCKPAARQCKKRQRGKKTFPIDWVGAPRGRAVLCSSTGIASASLIFWRSLVFEGAGCMWAAGEQWVGNQPPSACRWWTLGVQVEGMRSQPSSL